MEEIRYSLKEILAQNEVNPQKSLQISYSNASPLLSKFFSNIKCKKEWNSFKQGKEYSLTKRQGELAIKLLEIIKLRMKVKNGKDVEIEPSVYFEAAEIVNELFEDVVIDSEPSVKEKLEHFLAGKLKKEVSIVARVKEKILELAIGAEADESVHLRAYDRFVWMKALEEAIYTLLDKWEKIFHLMEEICDRTVEKENALTFLILGLNSEIDEHVKEELEKHKEYQALKKKQLDNHSDKTVEKIGDELKKIEEEVRRRCSEKIANGLPVPNGIGGEELLRSAQFTYDIVQFKRLWDRHMNDEEIDKRWRNSLKARL